MHQRVLKKPPLAFVAALLAGIAILALATGMADTRVAAENNGSVAGGEPVATQMPTIPAPVGPPDWVFGDVNCTGQVTATDALLVLQFITDLIPAIPCALAADVGAADVNQDGVINSIDALLMLQFVADFVPSLPVSVIPEIPEIPPLP